ncbi:Uncharacterised protein [Vibrio cholerae]|nr:Uncharacterised protein [Vibrio cholerae]CSB32038.1 Uncharacterised protein [Vibrio cholerae]CSB55964.1 Uncharacterised protein [Vibrio cholerae]CSC37519.1 Uncharacterised protein [Vibrio cholerae]CSC80893.1 Uncharacterised protein [Vibrio cholerae]
MPVKFGENRLGIKPVNQRKGRLIGQRLSKTNIMSLRATDVLHQLSNGLIKMQQSDLVRGEIR